MTPEQAAIRSEEYLRKIEALLRASSSFGRGAAGLSSAERVRATAGRNVDKQLLAAAKATKLFRDELYRTTDALKKFRYILGGAAKESERDRIRAERTERKLQAQREKAAARERTNAKNKGSPAVSIPAAADELPKTVSGFKLAVTAFSKGIGVISSVAGAALEFIDSIQTLKTVTADYLSLIERGYRVSNPADLLVFYRNAARAGMSLEEFTKLIDENRASVARTASFDEYSRQLEVTAKQLRNLGIFGADARQLAATMRTAATELGVPQERLNSVISGQISVFNELRKSTGMTADGFRQLIADLTANENVQENLIGLSKSEREARLQQLTQIATMGHTLGMTEQAAKRLADALLAQRRATARERFQAAGRARQVAAMLGIGAAEAEEFARLSGKKNLTAEEADRYRQLAARVEGGLQAMQNTGDMTAEFIADQFMEAMGPAQRAVMQASAVGQLQIDSGKVIQKDFANSVGEFGKAVGVLVESMAGLQKSPLVDLIGDAVKIAGAAASLALALKVFKVGGAGLISGLLKSNGPTDLLENGKPIEKGTATAKGGDRLKSLGKGLGAGAIFGLAGMGTDLLSEQLEESGNKASAAVASIASSALEFAGIGAMLGSVVPGIGTAVGAGIGALGGTIKGLLSGDNLSKITAPLLAEPAQQPQKTIDRQPINNSAPKEEETTLEERGAPVNALSQGTPEVLSLLSKQVELQQQLVDATLSRNGATEEIAGALNRTIRSRAIGAEVLVPTILAA